MTLKDQITLSVYNESSLPLYIAIKRADSLDGPWLGHLSYTYGSQIWVNDFDQSSCVLEIPHGDEFSVNFPKYDTGYGCRMYISVEKLTGAPDLATAKFIYDKVEMGWNATWNQTSVDFFAIPIQLSVNGGLPVGFKSGVTRSSIITALQAMPAPYKTFMYPLNETNPSEIYRYFSPAKASSMSGYKIDDCLGKAIEAGMKLIANYNGTFDYGGFKMSDFAKLGPDSLKATCNAKTITLSGITSPNAFSNSILPSPNDAAGQKVAGIIGCALNRGVLWDPTKWGENGGQNNGYPQYYYVKSKIQNHFQFNYYAQVLHNNSIDGKCYAQSYDDFFHQDASISVNGGDSAVITVLPFD